MSSLDHDHLVWTDERLLARSAELADQVKIVRSSPERLAQVQQEISLVSMELFMRKQEESVLI